MHKVDCDKNLPVLPYVLHWVFKNIHTHDIKKKYKQPSAYIHADYNVYYISAHLLTCRIRMTKSIQLSEILPRVF